MGVGLSQSRGYLTPESLVGLPRPSARIFTRTGSLTRSGTHQRRLEPTKSSAKDVELLHATLWSQLLHPRLIACRRDGAKMDEEYHGFVFVVVYNYL